MSQSVQVVGALLVLASFLPALVGRYGPGRSGRGGPEQGGPGQGGPGQGGPGRLGRYVPGATARLWLRFVGASLITMDAIAEGQWGFLLLGGVCALFAFAGLVDWARGRPADGREAA